MIFSVFFSVRWCQNGIISALEKFFTWYGRLVSTYPWTSIIICVAVTVGGGLGLLRFYEEGDAASLVIPPHSEFRRNIDWMDDNFPREVKSSCTFNLSPWIMQMHLKLLFYCRSECTVLCTQQRMYLPQKLSRPSTNKEDNLMPW